MLVKIFYQKFGRFVQLSKYFGLPYIWNSETNTISVSPNLLANTIILHFCLLIQLSFLVGQTVKFKVLRDLKNLNFLLPISYATTFLAMFISVIAYRPYVLGSLINTLHTFKTQKIA